MVRRIVGATLVLLAILGAVKWAFARVPSQGFLRADGLYPLWALWERGTAPGWFLPALAGIAILAAGVASGWADRVRTPAFLTSAWLVAVAVWSSMALTNGGFPSGLTHAFTGGEDYWSALTSFGGARDVWSAWTLLQASLPLHATTHPPGAVALLDALSRLLGGNVTAVAVAVVALSALTLFPVHAWARDLAGERVARRAVLLWMTAPASMLYGATCMDMVFAVPLVIAAWLFQRAIANDDGRAAAGSGFALGLGLLMTFAAGVQALAFVLVALGARRIKPLAVTGLVSLGVLLAARLLTGFDWWSCFREAARLDAGEWPAWTSASYYGWTRLMGALDVAILFGAALFATWVGALRRGVPQAAEATRWGRATAIACVGALAVGAFKIGETGRILVFALPAVVLPVASLLEDDDTAVGLIAAAGLAQAFLFEAVLDTRW